MRLYYTVGACTFFIYCGEIALKGAALKVYKYGKMPKEMICGLKNNVFYIYIFIYSSTCIVN